MTEFKAGVGRAWVTEYFKGIEKQYAKKEPVLSTGFVDLDNVFEGLKPGSLTVIGGRPSMGKTFMALNILDALSRNNKDFKAAFLSTDKSQESICEKLMALKSGVPGFRLSQGRLTAADWPRLASAAGNLAEQNITLSCDPRLDFTGLNAFCDKWPDLELLVIDSLNMMVPLIRDNREQEVTSIVQELKRVALERNIPVIATANLSRNCDSRQDKRPILSDLRDSGALEDHADTVLFLYRDNYYVPPEFTQDWEWMEVIAAKGAVGYGDCRLIYYRETGLLTLPTKEHFVEAENAA